MKKIICVLCSLLVLCLLPVLGQPLPVNPMTRTPNSEEMDPRTGLPLHPLTKFDLDFPGGTPADLVRDIEKATGKPLNVIIPTDDAPTQLPPLKLSEVDIPQLFDAIGPSSSHVVSVSMGFGGAYSQQTYSYGFHTADNPISDDSIWYFHVEKPTLPPVTANPPNTPVCRFYQLQSYLNHGFTVDDITTAIQTGWKMAGVTSPPELNYHKETNLLIACGNPDDLATIQSVLNTLPGTAIDQSQMDYLFKQANKVSNLESQIDELKKKVSASTANSTGNNSGK